MPNKAVYESIKLKVKQSSGNINKWKENVKHNTPTRLILTYNNFAIAIIVSMQKARINEGEAPAKIKNIKLIAIKNSFNALLFNKKPTKYAESKPIIARCIPDSANTCERPAFLKLAESSKGIKSLFAVNNAKRR